MTSFIFCYHVDILWDCFGIFVIKLRLILFKIELRLILFKIVQILAKLIVLRKLTQLWLTWINIQTYFAQIQILYDFLWKWVENLETFISGGDAKLESCWILPFCGQIFWIPFCGQIPRGFPDWGPLDSGSSFSFNLFKTHSNRSPTNWEWALTDIEEKLIMCQIIKLWPVLQTKSF